MHGKQSVTTLDTTTPLFVGLPEETTVARYHSLAAQEETFPECLQVTARTSDGEIMALQHKTKAVYGVQFHPESILTPLGKKMLENFLQLANAEKKEKTMIKEAIVKLAAKQNLDYETAEASMDEIMGGKASPVQMSAFLTAMAMKGETIEEITACAAGMRKHCVRLLHDQDVLEIVGTGGDHSNSFNISTTSSLVISAAGVPVAKHGNRAASSKSGAADVLEALGVKITIDPAKSAEVLKKIGLCFLFAQNYHLSMKYVAPVRKELGIRTIFNILGPLTNPAGANMELMGVYDEALVEPLARVLANLGVKRADRVVSKGVAHSFLKVLERVFFGIHWLKVPFLTVVAVSDLSDQVVLSAVAQEHGERIHRRIRHDPLTALINYSGAGICPGCAGRKINLSVYCMLMADRCD